jgi:hypothetical protein
MSEGEDLRGEVIPSLTVSLDESQLGQGVTEACGGGVVSPQCSGYFRKGEGLTGFGKGLKDG